MSSSAGGLVAVARAEDRDLVLVERALYEADQRVGDPPEELRRTWQEYAKKLHDVVARAAASG
jgi:hypothetical protein